MSGMLSPEAIRRVVLRNLSQVQHCHEQALAANPSAGGRVVVRFLIGRDGVVLGSSVAESTYSVPSGASCIANAVRRWQFPSPSDSGVVTVNYPFLLAGAESANGDVINGLADTRAPPPPPALHGPRAEPPPSAAARDVSALAALSLQGGVTRYDLPTPVSIPDRTATMVMLVSTDVPGQRLYLFAPNPGVPASAAHPFQVARFTNQTPALLERGPVAIFEAGAYLGEGMLDVLPAGARTTIPFALEPALTVESSATDSVEGARLLTMRREAITLERFNVHRTRYHLRNGLDRMARVLVRHELGGADLYEPPAGTERAEGSALVPSDVPVHGEQELLVTTRTAFTVDQTLDGEEAKTAIEQYLHQASIPAAQVQALRTALDQQRQLEELAHSRADLDQRRNDLQSSSEETRQNLAAIEHNRQAADLRARLTARLAAAATEIDQVTRHMVELDTQFSEQRVRLTEALREIDIDVSRSSSPPPGH